MATHEAEMLLSVRDLAVRQGGHRLLQPQSFQLAAGDRLVILGESGAGKSLLLKALMGAFPEGLTAEGQVSIHGDASAAGETTRRRPLWGRTLGWLPQEPSVALDPLHRLLPQLAAVHQRVNGRAAADAARLAASNLREQGLGPFEQHYAWQISGGMAQRAATSMALAGGARLVLADEPTKGLDPAWRDSAIDRLRAVADEGGAVLVVTHDLAVARRLGGRLMVMKEGQLLESGDTDAVLAAPAHPFTRALLAAEPTHWAARPVRGETSGRPVLEAARLGHGWDGRWLFRAFSLSLRSGDRVALQGDSGCGKSTLGNVLLGLIRPREGQVIRAPDLAPHALQKLYQDPLTSFALSQTLGEALEDVRRRHGASPSTLSMLLDRLRLDRALLARTPRALSGGQLQRMAIARALLVRPALLFADEPTSRLDLVTQRHTAELLAATVAEQGTALLLVTHDADLAAALTDRQIRLSEPAIA